MTLPISGITGYNSWPGWDPLHYAYETEKVTMPNYIYDMWKATIHSKNHINGDDVINTLSEGGGYWSYGMDRKTIKKREYKDIEIAT